MTATATPPDSTDSPRRGRPGYDRETLIRVCVEVFNVHGYDATSMGMLSKHLGISKSAIYHHVDSKEEILDQALDQALSGLEAVLQNAAQEGRPAAEQLNQVVDGTVRVLVDQMPNVTLLLRLRGNSEIEKQALERRRRITHELADRIAQAQAEGSIRDDLSPRHASRLLLGMINSIVDWYRPEAGDNVDGLARTVRTMATSGLRSRPSG